MQRRRTPSRLRASSVTQCAAVRTTVGGDQRRRRRSGGCTSSVRRRPWRQPIVQQRRHPRPGVGDVRPGPPPHHRGMGRSARTAGRLPEQPPELPAASSAERCARGDASASGWRCGSASSRVLRHGWTARPSSRLGASGAHPPSGWIGPPPVRAPHYLLERSRRRRRRARAPPAPSASGSAPGPPPRTSEEARRCVLTASMLRNSSAAICWLEAGVAHRASPARAAGTAPRARGAARATGRLGRQRGRSPWCPCRCATARGSRTWVAPTRITSPSPRRRRRRASRR